MSLVTVVVVVVVGLFLKNCKTKTALPFPEYAERIGLRSSLLLFY